VTTNIFHFLLWPRIYCLFSSMFMYCLLCSYYIMFNLFIHYEVLMIWFDCNHGDNNIICYLCICFIICSSCIYMAVNFFPILSWTSRNLATQRSRHMASPFCKSASWYFGGMHFFWQATDNLEWILKEGLTRIYIYTSIYSTCRIWHCCPLH